MLAINVRRLAVIASLAILVPGQSATAAEDLTGLSPLVRGFSDSSDAPLKILGTHDKLRMLRAEQGLAEAIADLRRENRRLDLRDLADLSRAALRAMTDYPVPERPADIEDPSEELVHVGLRAGDLDGDGLEDVLDLIFGIDSLQLAAREGDSGNELWRMPLSGFDAIPIALEDATGDGAADVLLLEISVGDETSVAECTPLSACYAVEGQTYTWTVSMVSGTDGSVAWSRASEGAVVHSPSESIVGNLNAYTGTAAATNAYVVPFPSGDHDGDGSQDVVIDEIDLVDPFMYVGTFDEDMSASVLAGASVAATRAYVVSGATGAPLMSKATATSGLAHLAPIGDLTGDGITDLIWDEDSYIATPGVCSWPIPGPDGTCVGAGVERRSIEMIDGATLLTGWTREMGGFGWLYPLGGDIDGDAAPELVFLGAGEEGVQSQILSGANGADVWSSPDIILGLIEAEGLDPVVSTAALLWGEVGIDYEIRRRSAADGSLLGVSTRHIELPTDSWDLFVISEFWLVPDANGDGSIDNFTQTTVYANRTYGHLFIENGIDGSELFARSGVGEPYAFWFPDMNGDGLSDMLDVDVVWHRHSSEVIFTGVSISTGEAIHQVHRAVHLASFIWLERTADLTGTGGADLLLSWTQILEDGTLESMLEAVEQSAATSIWTVGSTLTAPPAPPAGAIIGTVTGEGSPFQGACVTATSTDGSEWAGIMAGADGTYALLELRDGDYIVEFADCMFGSYMSEWYDDATSFEEATLVTVAGGVIGGIDADLAAWS